jgi:asparagine synthase (glutamine-hydrolysing)
MCGIAGILDAQVHPELDELDAMVQIMVHRGPDAKGVMVRGPIAMGMRRLSIIDLKSGEQPISNHDNSITVIFNGEIYNFIELRNELIKKGYIFKTSSDTEVLVHLYSEYGYEMLPHLNGMFAFAIWDAKDNSLFLARDRMGIKPLYYAQVGQRFLFASELKSILTHSGLDLSLNMNAIADYLRLGYIPREETPYKVARKLLPGHYLSITGNQCKSVQWWDLKKEQGRATKLTTSNFDRKTVDIFDQSIQLRMRSDVPVASFLSGGLDSSLISVTASDISPIKFQTYNVKFSDAVFDESPYADIVAKYAKTDHHQVVVSASDALEKLPMLLWYMDEPMSDSAIIPNYLVSEFAAKNVKVCLSGLGGDELFGGYSRYIDKPLGPYRRFFARFHWLVRLLLPVLERTHPNYATKIAPLTEKKAYWRGYLNHIQLFDTLSLKKLGLKELGNTEQIIMELWNAYPGDDDIGRRQFIDQHTYLPDQILALTDRMSMAVSLETRVPFLDHRLVKQATQIPDAKKQSDNGEFKIWLKNTLGKRVPEEILNRRKWGFDAPAEKWVYSPVLENVIEKLPEYLSELLDEEYVRKLVADKHDPRYHNLVWRLLVLAIWLKVHTCKEPPQLTVSQLFQ